MRHPMPTEPTGHADSPSLDTELALTDSETESDEEVPVINTGDQNEEQMDEELTITVLHQMIRKPQTAKPKERNSKGTCKLHRTLSSLQNLEKYLSFTDQFFVEKPHKEESGKTNAEIEVQSMVSVPIP
ncbi:hypothetical protein Tco_0791889 [Tanacetum coccineum]